MAQASQSGRADAEITVAGKLDSVEWNFPRSVKRSNLHSIHPYPAKFIPEIPQALISLFHPGDEFIVLDPFCGSGTTLVEASNAGLPAVGVDLSPLSSLISKVKTTPLREYLGPITSTLVSNAKKRTARGCIQIPDIPNIDHWFKREIQEALSALMTEIQSVPDVDSRDALRVAVSSIIVRVSNQDSDTRYAAVEKTISQQDVWSLFERAADHIGDMCFARAHDLFALEHSVRVINKDVLQVEPDEIGKNIGLVVTSPPYPNAYEYWLYHKYRMFWLGMDPIEMKSREIGARAHYFKKNHHTKHNFEEQMVRCFWLLSRVMRNRAHACFVVGRSIIHGEEVDNEALLERAALRHGFRRVGYVGRDIALSRKSFNLHHGKIRREGILVFRLEDA